MDEGIAVQMEDNLPSIEHTLRPIVFVSWFLGVGIARPPKCPKAVTIILRIIHFGLCSVAIDSFTSNQILNINCENYIYKIMYYMNKVMCYVSTHYYVYHGIEQYEKWPELMSKIKKLDRKIRRETPMNDLPIEVVEVLAILATFGPLFIIIYAYYYFIRPEDTVASELRLYYTIAQSLINNFIFVVIVYVLYHRFQTINKLIMQLDKKFNEPGITSKIRDIRKLHKKICDVVIMVNDIHGFHLPLFLTNCFTMVVTTLYRIYIVDKNYAFMLINNILWILYATQLGLMCWICTLMRQESEKTGVIISTIVLNCNAGNLGKLNKSMRNQLNLVAQPELQFDGKVFNKSSSYNLNYVVMENLDRDYVRNEINDFSIQLQQHRVAITACNFFEINYALFSRFVFVIITYLIILNFFKPNSGYISIGDVK